MKLQPLTGQEHLVMGARLSRLLTEAQEIVSILCTAYSKPTWRKALAIEHKVQSLKSAMNDILCAELATHGDRIEGVPFVRVYNGWQEGPEREHRLQSYQDARDKLRSDIPAELADNPWSGEQ